MLSTEYCFLWPSSKAFFFCVISKLNSSRREYSGWKLLRNVVLHVVPLHHERVFYWIEPNLSRLTMSSVATFVCKIVTFITNRIVVHISFTGKSVSITKLSLVSTNAVYPHALLVEKLSRCSDYTMLLLDFWQNVSGTRPVSHLMIIRDYFPKGKAAGRAKFCIWCQGLECVKIYRDSSIRLHGNALI